MTTIAERLAALAKDRTLWTKTRGAEEYRAEVDGITLRVDATRPQGAVWQVKCDDVGRTASAGNVHLAINDAVTYAQGLASTMLNPLHTQ